MRTAIESVALRTHVQREVAKRCIRCAGAVRIRATASGRNELTVAALTADDRPIGRRDGVARKFVGAALDDAGIVGLELAVGVGDALHALVTNALTELARGATIRLATISAGTALAAEKLPTAANAITGIRRHGPVRHRLAEL